MMPTTLFCKIFEGIVERYSTNTAVKWVGPDPCSCTYLELNTRANQLANYLLTIVNAQFKPKPSELTIGVFMEPSCEWVVTLLAIMKVGMVYVPIQTAHDNSNVGLSAHIVESCGIQLLITSKGLREHKVLNQLRAPSPKIYYYEELFEQPFSASDNPDLTVLSEQLAYITFTSGSTGTPKGVEIEHVGLEACLRASQKILHLQSNDCIAQYAQISYDASIFEVMIALGTGATLFIVPPEKRVHPSALASIYTQYSVTVAIFSPSMLRQLEPAKFKGLKSLRLISTGEALSKEIVGNWSKMQNLKLFNGYGPSEATICTSLGECTSEIIDAGQVIEGLSVYILKESGSGTFQFVNSEEEGEIYIIGPGLARGYRNLPGLTAECFVPNPAPSSCLGSRAYKTNDLGKLVDGKLIITGRKDRAVKIHSILVHPEEIESKLMQVNSISQAVVVIKKNDQGFPIITAYIKMKDQQLFNLRDTYKAIEGKLRPFMRPVRWIVVDTEMPVTRHGKVDIHALEQQYCKQECQYLRPLDETGLRDDIERDIACLWSECLCLPDQFKYRAEDDFVYLGGTSIQAMALLEKVSKKFKLAHSVTVSDFLNYPSISALARKVRRLLKKSRLYELCVDLKNESAHTESAHTTPLSPLFLIHTLMGDPVIDYDQLMRCWNFPQQVWGIKALGLVDPIDMSHHLTEIAQDYIEVIRSKQKNGPYFVGGWSGGGIIAHKIAELLEKQGEKVLVLAIDSECPLIFQNMERGEFTEWLLDLAFQALTKRLRINEDAFAKKANQLKTCLSKEEAVIQLCSLLSSLTITEAEGEQAFNFIATIKNILLGVLSDPIKPINNMVLFIADQTQAKWHKLTHLGWNFQLQSSIVCPNQNHDSIVLTEASARKIATNIYRLCDEFQLQYDLPSLHQDLISANPQYAKIQRLVDRKYYDIEDLFVNVAIVKEAEQLEKESAVQASVFKMNQKEAYPDALLSSYESIYQPKQLIALNKLFNRQPDESRDPNRQLLLGRAGIGKTTLCHYIAHEWGSGRLWRDQFYAVFYIPLRNLAGQYYTEKPRTIVDVILYECFNGSNKHEKLIERLLKTCPDRVLLLLDGYDEVGHLKKGDHNQKTLDQLVRHPKWIITSRPLFTHALDVDRTLETIGFTDSDITQYVKNFFKSDAENVKTLQDYLRKNLSINGMAHIPVVLEFICGIWNERPLEAKRHKTLTELYLNVRDHLNRRYLARINSNESHESLEALAWDTEEHCDPMMRFFETLAFEAMESESIIFSNDLIIKAKETTKVTGEDIVKFFKAGYLKRGDGKSGDNTSHYYFIHLSIQEFFAASHLARHFKSGPHSTDQKVVAFLYKNKHNPRFEMVWRFLVGLLSAIKSEGHSHSPLQIVWDILFEPVCDVFNISQIRLNMYCMEECQLNEALRQYNSFMEDFKEMTEGFINCRDSLVEEWLRLSGDHKRNRYHHYQSDPAVYIYLTRLSCWRSAILYCPQLLRVVKNRLYEVAQEACKKGQFFSPALRLLLETNQLEAKTHGQLKQALQSADEHQRIFALNFLDPSAFLTEEEQSEWLIRLLKDDNEKIRRMAFVFKPNSAFCQDKIFVKQLLECCCQNDEAVLVAQYFKITDVLLITGLLNALDDPDERVRQAAARKLVICRYQDQKGNLLQKVLSEMLGWAKEAHPCYRILFYEWLVEIYQVVCQEDQTRIDQVFRDDLNHLLFFLAEESLIRLADKNGHVFQWVLDIAKYKGESIARKNAIKVLGRLSRDQTTILEALKQIINNKEEPFPIHVVAIDALSELLHPNDVFIETLLNLLNDTNANKDIQNAINRALIGIIKHSMSKQFQQIKQGLYKQLNNPAIKKALICLAQQDRDTYKTLLNEALKNHELFDVLQDATLSDYFPDLKEAYQTTHEYQYVELILNCCFVNGLSIQINGLMLTVFNEQGMSVGLQLDEWDSPLVADRIIELNEKPEELNINATNSEAMEQAIEHSLYEAWLDDPDDAISSSSEEADPKTFSEFLAIAQEEVTRFLVHRLEDAGENQEASQLENRLDVNDTDEARVKEQLLTYVNDTCQITIVPKSRSIVWSQEGHESSFALKTHVQTRTSESFAHQPSRQECDSWYTDEDINNVLTRLLDKKEAEIFAAQHPLVSGAAELFQSVLSCAIQTTSDTGKPSIIPINLVREAPQQSSIVGTHWVCLIIKLDPPDQAQSSHQAQPKKVTILYIDPLGNDTGKDREVTDSDLIALGNIGGKWSDHIIQIIGLIRGCQPSFQHQEIVTKVIVTGLVQQIDGSSCGPLLIANALAEVKSEQRRNYELEAIQTLRKEHAQFLKPRASAATCPLGIFSQPSRENQPMTDSHAENPLGNSVRFDSR